MRTHNTTVNWKRISARGHAHDVFHTRDIKTVCVPILCVSSSRSTNNVNIGFSQRVGREVRESVKSKFEMRTQRRAGFELVRGYFYSPRPLRYRAMWRPQLLIAETWVPKIEIVTGYHM